jgi:hypothetical protein
MEAYFVFASIWAFGGCMLMDNTNDYRAQFSKWWTEEWKTILFPEQVIATFAILTLVGGPSCLPLFGQKWSEADDSRGRMGDSMMLEFD